MLGMLGAEDVEIVQYLAGQVGWRYRNHVNLLAGFEDFGGSFLLAGAEHRLRFRL